MCGFLKVAIVVILVIAPSGSVSLRVVSGQGGSTQNCTFVPGGTLPEDVDPVSCSRLPMIKREDLDERVKKVYDAAVASSPDGQPRGVAATRLHGTGLDVRLASPLGRPLTELAILITARVHDQPYEWSLHEMEALAVGLDPGVIDVVRNHKSLGGVGEKEAIIIQVGRELGKHKLSSETYARALKLLGKSNLVDIVSLMSNYTATAARLTAVNSQLPPGWKQFLPLPFALPDDIHADSRSRLPLIKTSRRPYTVLYSRQLVPVGTEPFQIAGYTSGLASLEASQGRRLMDLAILVAAREYNQQYDWTMNELAARQHGLDPTIIDVVRFRRPVTGLGDKEAAIIEFGRDLFGQHVVQPDTYARAVKFFGERDLVDFASLMGEHAGDAMLLTAFDQHLPTGQLPLLPIASGGSR